MAFDRKQHKAEWDKKRRRNTIDLISRWKKIKGCALCGYKDHACALQLDHLDPSTKDTYLSKNRRAYNPNWNRKRLKQELAKCQILCANCHSVRTFQEKHFMNKVNSVGPI
jgi:5-methylcytosine-specific restriction endonuclease McrA